MTEFNPPLRQEIKKHRGRPVESDTLPVFLKNKKERRQIWN